MRVIARGARLIRFQERGPSAGAPEPSNAIRRLVDVQRTAYEGWPVFELVPPNVRPGHVAVYLHGGKYASEILGLHWTFIARLARATGRRMIVPISPTTPNGATIGDVLPVVQRLYATLAQGPDRVALVGDSAGGTLALATVQQRAADVPAPDKLVLLSPWLDATMEHDGVAEAAPLDPFLTVPKLVEYAQKFAGGLDLADPSLSPMRGPLDRMPDTALFTGTDDLLNPDARHFRDRCVAGGVSLTYRETPGALHDWFLLPVPEARTTRREVAAFLNG